MSFVTYTPTTNVWWDIVVTPLFVPSANGDPLTYDNLTLSTVSTNPSGYTQNGFQGKVLDNLAFLKTHAMPAAGTSFTRVSNGSPSIDSTASTAGWGLYHTNPFAQWQNLTLGDAIIFPLGPECLPNGVTLTGVSQEFTGSASDVALPATLPTLNVYKVDKFGNGTNLGAQLDSSGTLGAYQAQHAVSVTGLSVTIDRSQFTYWAYVQPEASTNSHVGMLVCSPVVTFTGASNLVW
jgi:hypothetical protein